MASEKFCCTWVALADATSKTHQSRWLQETLSLCWRSSCSRARLVGFRYVTCICACLF
ncbi:uncharacterized protein J3R85_001162 [Psidium guajava]|nr:uncharacterized protein J3R85_001162 [Psidium guajava]